MWDDYFITETFDDDRNGEVDFIQGVSQFSVKDDKNTKWVKID